MDRRQATDFEHLADEPRAESSVRAWIGVLAASLLLLGVYGVLRERLNPTPEREEPAAQSDANAERGTDRKRGRSSKRRRRGSAETEITVGNDDFVVDDREFRDLIAEGKSERAAAEAATVVEDAPPFIPPPEMFQPDGPYEPVASYVEPGARDDVVTLDLSSNSDSGGPLPESAVKRVLRVSALMPCYDPVVQKVPQMRGRVRMRFVVAPDGHVMEATITDSALRSRTVEKCIVDRAKRFRFPTSSQKTRFSTHFDFSSR